MRRAGRVPRRRPVVNVYGNSDAGRRVGRAARLRAGCRPSGSAGARPRRCSPPGAGRAAALSPHAATRVALDARLLLRPGHGGRPARRPRGLRHVLPDRLRGGARPALRRDRRHLRGPPPQPRPSGAQGVKVAGAQRRRPHARADRRPAHGGPARRPPDRDHPRRGHVRARPPHARGGPRGRAAGRRAAASWWPATPTSTPPTSRRPRSTARSTTRAAPPSTAPPAARS